MAAAPAPQSASWNTIKALSAGAIAGAVSRTATSPLERVKCVQQVQVASGVHNKYGKGIISSLTLMVREEGVKSLWKGNGTNIARIAPYSAFQFYLFDKFKYILSSEDAANSNAVGLAFRASTTREFRESTTGGLIYGGLSGFTSCIICYPLDLVRSYLTVQTTGTQYKGIVHTMTAVVKNDGVRGLYRGLAPTLIVMTPYISINFATFDALKKTTKAFFQLANPTPTQTRSRCPRGRNRRRYFHGRNFLQV